MGWPVDYDIGLLRLLGSGLWCRFWYGLVHGLGCDFAYGLGYAIGYASGCGLGYGPDITLVRSNTNTGLKGNASMRLRWHERGSRWSGYWIRKRIRNWVRIRVGIWIRRWIRLSLRIRIRRWIVIRGRLWLGYGLWYDCKLGGLGCALGCGWGCGLGCVLGCGLGCALGYG